MGSSSTMRAGYSQVEITPPIGTELADRSLITMSSRDRISEKIRDRLYARALHVESPSGGVTIVAADLLIITGRLFARVAELAGVAQERLLLSATHTHSGPGGYWDGGRAELVMGSFRADFFEQLAGKLAEAARLARSDLRRATLLGATSEVVGASANRRRRHGPVDPELTLVRFATEGAAPIDLVSFGAHPVIGTMLEPRTISADYPGVVCERLTRRGVRPIFIQGAVGGLSPLFPEFPMGFDDHLALVGGLLESGYERAERSLRGLACASVEAKLVRSPVRSGPCHIIPRTGPVAAVAEGGLRPLRRWMERLGEDGLGSEPEAPLHLVRLGETAVLGTPCDLGVSVALALKNVLRTAGVSFPVVGSQCDGYVGYVHMPSDYAHAPEPGFREMAYYENAMSFGGWDVGESFVRAVDRAL